MREEEVGTTVIGRFGDHLEEMCQAVTECRVSDGAHPTCGLADDDVSVSVFRTTTVTIQKGELRRCRHRTRGRAMLREAFRDKSIQVGLRIEVGFAIANRIVREGLVWPLTTNHHGKEVNDDVLAGMVVGGDQAALASTEFLLHKVGRGKGVEKSQALGR